MGSWRSRRPGKIRPERSVAMGRPYRRYTRQFKQEAMDLVRERGYEVARAARDLGVPVTTLNMWLEKAGWVRPAEGPVDPDADRLTPPSEDPARLRLRVQELERQVKRLEMEKEILKKATAFFASQNT
jgi:transposase-like protein